MGLFSKKVKETPKPVEERSYDMGGLYFNGLSSFASSKAMRLAAVYGAVNLISNSIASMDCTIYKVDNNGIKNKINHNLDFVLNTRPDKTLNHYEYFKMMTESVLLKGNAYSLIIRDENLNVIGLQYLNPDLVVPMVQKDGSIKYIVSGIKTAIDQSNMIHLWMHIDENYCGISTIRYAADVLANAADTDKTAANFFKSGGNLSGVIKAKSTLTNDQKKQIQQSWAGAFNTQNEKVAVAVLPEGFDFQAISVNPQDATLLESRAFNVYEICRIFNLPPSKLGVHDSSSYNSLEQDQITYLQDTLMPLVEMFQAEFNLKLLKPSQIGKIVINFNISRLIKADKKSESEYLKTLMVNGILSLNEVRNELGYEPVEGGDNHYMQTAMATVNFINNQSNNDNAD